MRIKIIAGNWKMNKDAAGTKELIERTESEMSFDSRRR